MIDIHTETLLTLLKAAKTLPGRPHVSTVWRWARKGATGRDGTKLRLEIVRVGTLLYTSAQALERFINALTAADVAHFEKQDERPVAETPKPRTTRRRERAIDRAEAELDALGV